MPTTKRRATVDLSELDGDFFGFVICHPTGIWWEYANYGRFTRCLLCRHVQAQRLVWGTAGLEEHERQRRSESHAEQQDSECPRRFGR